MDGRSLCHLRRGALAVGADRISGSGTIASGILLRPIFLGWRIKFHQRCRAALAFNLERAV
jgi:hypothetical protein